jgi:hypothetical protein
MMYELFSLLFLASFICLIIGLIKPALFSKFIKGEITKKKMALIFGSATVVLFVLVGATAPKINVEQKTQSAISDQTGQVEETTLTTDTAPKATPEATTTPQKTTKATTPTPTTPTITPTPIPTPVSSQTISQKNAVQKAKSYLGYTAFSHDGLVAQLEYEQFSHADAVYGADNSGANWNEQSAKKAKAYVDYSAFSHGSLVQQLIYDKFTQEQAEYGANAVGL